MSNLALADRDLLYIQGAFGPHSLLGSYDLAEIRLQWEAYALADVRSNGAAFDIPKVVADCTLESLLQEEWHHLSDHPEREARLQKIRDALGTLGYSPGYR